MSDALHELKSRLGRLSDLEYASSLAHWDQQTKMPPRGGEARADVLATLAELTHREFAGEQTGRLLERARVEVDASEAGGDPDSDDVRLLAVVGREWEKARRVPNELAAELARAASTGQEAWVAARAASDFASFVPHLQRNFELARRYVDCHAGHDGFDCAYDVLFDDYEPGMRTAQVRGLFDELKRELIPLLEAIDHAPAVDEAPLHIHFEPDGQRRVAREVLGLMGFDDHGWRLDDTVHPFAIRVGEGDVRLTTRFEDKYWPMSLYGAMHECGHGLYEDGIAPAYQRSTSHRAACGRTWSAAADRSAPCLRRAWPPRPGGGSTASPPTGSTGRSTG
jgi:carboxypeptidase Taq